MSTMYAYDYTDFLNDAVATDRLRLEIQESQDITTALCRLGEDIIMNETAAQCEIRFKVALSTEEQTALAAIVAAHTGEPVTVANLVKLDTPAEQDGRSMVVVNPAPKGWRTFVTGTGDELNPTPPDSGRGEGDAIELDFADAETGVKSLSISFIEPIALHTGEVHWDGASFDRGDWFSFDVEMPATTVTANGSTAGNCNLVSVGDGLNMIVPADGDGTHDVDLSAAVPVPSSSNTGYYDCDYTSGVLAISSAPGTAHFNLFDFSVCPKLLNKISMASTAAFFSLRTYRVEWIHPTWSLRLKCSKQSTTGGKILGNMYTFRPETT